MKKYINPKMEIKSFYSESILTGSTLEDNINGWASSGTTGKNSLLTIDMSDTNNVKKILNVTF